MEWNGIGWNGMEQDGQKYRREENQQKQGPRGGTLGNPFATGEIEKIIKIDEIVMFICW